MKENNTVSIKEFAQLNNVTRQAVYKRLKTTLKDKVVYISESDNKEIRLKIEVLTEEQKEKLKILRQIKENQQEHKKLTEQAENRGVCIQRTFKQSLSEKTKVESQQGQQNEPTTTELFQNQITALKAEIDFLRCELSNRTGEVEKLTALSVLQAQQIERLQLKAAEQPEEPATTESRTTGSRPPEDEKPGFWGRLAKLLKTQI